MTILHRLGRTAVRLVALSALVATGQAFAQSNAIESVSSGLQGATTYLRVQLKTPLTKVPASFSVNTPPRVALDFADTGNEAGKSSIDLAQGDVRNVALVQSGSRTRLVLNLKRPLTYTTAIEGKDLVVALSPVAMPGDTASASAYSFARGDANASHVLRDLDFRRGKDGEGRVVVDLSDPGVGVDIRQQGGNLVIDFLQTALPEHLRRRSDVTDFATPVTSMIAQQVGDRVRLTVVSNGLWEHNAYQSDNRFVLEVKRVAEDSTKLGGGRADYKGEKLSLNFQNVDVRSVLQVIADFTDFNIITSDSVQGNLTLRLKDVPWDQALDIILQAKGLDMRKNGNVIWIAPGDELASRRSCSSRPRQQIADLEPLQTESFQINYHKAKEIFDFLKSKDQTMLSKRGRWWSTSAATRSS
jgi:type IV pilus assembly protein PilQ